MRVCTALVACGAGTCQALATSMPMCAQKYAHNTHTRIHAHTHKLTCTCRKCTHVFVYVQGNLIGLAKERLPVVVSFESGKPVSFTANIDFMDEEGKRFSIPVTACADNCLFTHQAFLEVRAHPLRVCVCVCVRVHVCARDQACLTTGFLL